jgi:putative colanic acid biosynthesis UDP-glucose lipid carrier transferase
MRFDAPTIDPHSPDGCTKIFGVNGLDGISSVGGVHTQISKKAVQSNGSWAKRTLDIIGASLGLFFLGLLLLLVALAIKLGSKGPVFFRQKRYGVGGKVFMIFKFRTMHVQESAGAFVQAQANDARVTRLGSFLRKTSIDELPQLLNVLVGQMSLVGPRPHAVAMDDFYARIIPAYAERLLVRPGLTGLAQISGHRGPTETVGAITQRLQHDRVYIRTWSVWSDVAIIIKTPLCLVQQKAF